MPRSSDLDSRLQARIHSFVDDISAIVREAALEAVREALTGTSAPSAAPAPTRRKKKKATRKSKAKKTASGRRVRRSPEELEGLADQFVAHVKAHPGQRLEEIGAALGIDTAELKRPVQLLMEAGKLRTEGQRRGTKYFSGGRASKAAPRKAAKKKRKKAARRRATKKKATRKKA